MTTPTLTCDTCESEIDVAKDPRAVVASITGHADVMCEACRMHAWDRWNARTLEDWPVSDTERLREAYRIKRGWRA